jgi:N-acetylglucosaminyldiphosphoundecaprenol N-acetyl-beta-D-mannosaminyltransferase
MATSTPATTLDLARTDILGVGIHATHMRQAVSAIDEAARNRRKGYVCVTGVHGVMEAQSDGEFKKILNRSMLTTPDGMPTVWVGRLQGFREMDRVYGPDLMLEVCRMSAERGYSHFLYGGKDGVVEKLADSLRARYPKLNIVGMQTPPFRSLNASEELALIENVRKTRPDFLWVGLSTPKQERFMARHIGTLDCTLMLGVGAAFDIHTGMAKDAPHWVKRAGLQWLHRLLQEPRRLWKRYLVNNPKFIWSIFMQVLRQGFAVRRVEEPGK